MLIKHPLHISNCNIRNPNFPKTWKNKQFKKLERKLIPADIDYNDVSSLRLEARQKLEKFRPVNIGQASRIGGVNPADVSVLIIYLDSLNRGKQNEE